MTEADRAAEEAIIAVIREKCPDDDILAEEGDYGRRQSTRRWIVDPLDGTTNYAHGFPWFAVSIGFEVDERVVLGVILNPCNEELFCAETGQGASLNGRPVRVSKTGRLDQALLATGFPYDRKDSRANNYDHFVNFQQAAQACRRPGVASLDLACTAAGRFDGYWEMKLKPGGTVSDFAGGPLDLNGREIVASNGLIHPEMLELLRFGTRP